jgi:NAD(P)-dependent dehydrogenase (short-subunit alcohol dehydrogenase family)
MNIFITGGLTGMGREMSMLYLNDGHKVGICSIEKYEDIKDQLLEGVTYFQANVTVRDEIYNAIKSFGTDNAGLDIVIANAGINHHKAKIPDFERGRNVLMTNVIGVVNTFEPAIEIMKEQGHGHLAALSSISAFSGLPGMAFYGASKAAVMSMCETFEIDLAGFGIQVTTLAPGFVRTPLTTKNKHKMPFVLEQNQAALMMYKALQKKKTLYVFPLPMKVMSKVLKHTPRFIYRSIMKRDLLGLSKG